MLHVEDDPRKSQKCKNVQAPTGVTDELAERAEFRGYNLIRVALATD